MPQNAQIFTTKECAWAQFSVKMLGRTIIGIHAFEFKMAIDKELLYAAGDTAIDLMHGNKSGSGSFTLLKYEFDLLNDAALAAGYESLLDVPHTLISVTGQFKKNITSVSRIVEVPALGFTDATVAMQQNAKMTEVPLPFIAPKIFFR